MIDVTAYRPVKYLVCFIGSGLEDGDEAVCERFAVLAPTPGFGPAGVIGAVELNGVTVRWIMPMESLAIKPRRHDA
ncbi:MAG: hypothetical protein ACRDHG_04685 [Anaerolineales bacterium]